MAGYLGELKPLMVVISFLGIFAILAGTIPGEFYAASYEGREINVPEYFEAVDISSFMETYNFTIDDPSWFEEEWELGGYNWIMNADYDDNFIGLGKKNYWWFFWVGTTNMKFRNTQGIDRGTFLNQEELNEDYDTEKDYTKYTCEGDDDPSVGCTVFFGFNTSKYDTPSQAWENGELYFMQGLGFDQINTSTNAWNLVGMLLIFQMPNIHPIINMIIAIPLWICIAYLIFALILKVIPFVSG